MENYNIKLVQHYLPTLFIIGLNKDYKDQNNKYHQINDILSLYLGLKLNNDTIWETPIINQRKILLNENMNKDENQFISNTGLLFKTIIIEVIL